MSNHGIKVDGRLYDVFVTQVSLSTNFLMKYAERNENGDLLYELIGCYFNQTMTIGKGESDTDFSELWDLLSSRSSVDGGIGHNVEIWLPIGKATFMMYTDTITLDMKYDRGTDTEWENMKLSFIATKPSRK